MSRPARHTIVAMIVFIALAGVFGWQWYQQRTDKQIAQTSKDFLTFDAATVTDITVVQGDQTVTLQKQTEQWIITSQTNAVADSSLVQTLFNTLNNALIQATVATTVETTTDYGLVDPAALHITLKNNDTIIAAVDVGKSGAVPGTWYGRIANDTATYLLSGTRQALTNLDFAQVVDNTAAATDGTLTQ